MRDGEKGRRGGQQRINESRDKIMCKKKRRVVPLNASSAYLMIWDRSSCRTELALCY